jgi:hypothetical protein
MQKMQRAQKRGLLCALRVLAAGEKLIIQDQIKP